MLRCPGSARETSMGVGGSKTGPVASGFVRDSNVVISLVIELTWKGGGIFKKLNLEVVYFSSN